MELVNNTTHMDPEHGQVTILKIYREYAVFDSDRDHGSVPGSWVVRYSTGDGDTHIEPVEKFVDRLNQSKSSE